MANRMILTKGNDNTDSNELNQPVESAAPAPATAPAPAPAQPAGDDRYAHMFAAWDLLPPQMLIRRVTHRVK